VGLHEKGYRRIWRRGPLYSKLEHRVVMAAMCREHCYYPLNGDGIPPGFDVHHLDFRKTHNCPSNLLLIEHTLHYHADQLRRNTLRWDGEPPVNFEDCDD
jgi:hypothetical protein